MRFNFASGVRNDLIQLISDQTAAQQGLLTSIRDQTDTLEALTAALNVYNGLRSRGTGHKIITFNFALVGTGHNNTTRESYIVPVGKRAILVSARYFMERGDIVVGIQTWNLILDYRPGDGSSPDLINVAGLGVPPNTPIFGDTRIDLELLAGQEVRFRTGGSLTITTLVFNGSAVIIEYDA